MSVADLEDAGTGETTSEAIDDFLATQGSGVLGLFDEDSPDRDREQLDRSIRPDERRRHSPSVE